MGIIDNAEVPDELTDEDIRDGFKNFEESVEDLVEDNDEGLHRLRQIQSAWEDGEISNESVYKYLEFMLVNDEIKMILE